MARTDRRQGAWKIPSVSGTGLKLFACVTMLIQSIGIVIVEYGMIQLEQYTQEELSQAMANDAGLMTLAGVGSVMQLIGGLAVPIFAFLLVEGIKNTRSYPRYLLTMLAFAVISEIPYDLAMRQSVWDMSSQNALFTMVICLLMLYFLKLGEERTGVTGMLLNSLIILGGVLWVTLLRCSYGLCMVLLTAVFYLFYARNVLKTVMGIMISMLYVTGPLSFYGIWCYNGERNDRFPKYVFYAFYPLHLLVLWGIAKFL